MADAVGTVRVDLFANLAEWSAGLNKASGQLKRFARETEKVGKGFEKTGRAMSVALTAPLAIFGGAAIKAASDAQDLQGAFNITFGDAADATTEWAVKVGDAMGRSTQTVQKTAIAFSEFFEDFAPTTAATVELSKQFTVLTQDFAAFKNVSDEQAQQVILKGLTGSAKGLKTLGVVLDDATVKAKAFELGIAKQGQELTEQQKVLARASIIYSALGKAQGEVARSGNDSEQIIRKTREEFDELLVTVGNQLLPVVNDFLKGVSGLIAEFQKLDDGTQKTILTVAGLAAALGPVALIFGTTLKFAGALLKPLAAAGAALGTFGKAAFTASTGAKQLGLSIAGAIGWFAALAPVAYEAGKAIGSTLNFGKQREQLLLTVLTGVEAKLKQMGLTAEEAAAGRRYFAEQADKGVQVTLAQVAAEGKLRASADATHAAFVQSVDDAIDQAVAMDEAAKSQAALKTTLDGLISGFGDLKGAAPTADELQAARDKVDVINASLREYHKQLALATAGGADAAKAQRVLGKEFISSISGVENWRDSIGKLPPEIQALIKEQDTLSNRTNEFGKKLENEFSNRVNAFGRALDKAFKTRNFGLELEKGIRDIGKSLTDQFDPLSVYAKRVAEINTAFKSGAISAEVYARAKAAAFAETPEGQKQVKLFDDITDALTDAVTGARSFGDAVKELVLDFLKTSIIKPTIQGALSGFFPQIGAAVTPQGGGFDFGNVLSSIGGFFGFGGSRDAGGRAMPGMAYRIGSGVAETFTPDVPGKITRGGASTPTIIQNFNGNDVGQYRASRRQIARQAKRSFA